MSDPANILDRYRSYSYHHILIACDNSQAADRIAKNDFEVSQFSQLGIRLDVTDEGDLIPVQENEDALLSNPPPIGKSVVLINGLRDTRYVIQNVEWETLTAAGVNSSDNGNSLAVEGKMTIQEPRGFEFMNVIDRVQDIFDTDATGIIFLLKTVFVGHLDSNPSSTVNDTRPQIISDLQPLQFILVNITATFDAAGGAYQLKFLGLNNGASRLPQVSRAAEMTPFTPTDRVLATVMAEFVEELNEKSTQDYEAVRDKIKDEFENDALPSTDPNDANNLRRVAYEVVLAPPYTEDEYVLDGFDPTIKEKDTEKSVGIIHAGTKYTVEQVLQKIMGLCSRVRDELKEGVDGVRYRYKIRSALEMKKIADQREGEQNVTTDQEVMQVTYYIERFVELDNISVTALLSGASSNDTITEQQIRDNLITFDYIFTGKNVDIKNFDMKLNQGLLFLQTLRSTDNKMNQREQLRGTPTNPNTTAGSIGAKDNVEEDEDGNVIIQSSIRSRTPIFPGTTAKDVITKNIGAPGDMDQFNAALQQHAALETLQTSLTIRGNPYLMSTTNRSASTPIDESDTSSEEDRSVRVLKNWNSIPAIARINIKMPENSETLGGINSPELIDFWYRGYYYIFKIKHVFKEGEFTQTLDMISMPQNQLIDPLQTSPVNETADSVNNQEEADEPETRSRTTGTAGQRRRANRARQKQRAEQAREAAQRTKQPPSTRRQRRLARQASSTGGGGGF